MKIIRSVVIVALTALFLIGLIALPTMALNDSVTEITTDGWVSYKKLNVIQFTYKTNPSGGYSDDYITKTVNDLPLPYGPKYTILDDQIISEFWFEISLYNVDVDELTDSSNAYNSTIAVLRPGESIALMAGAKIFVAGRPEQSAFAPIESNMYGCRLYLDNDYNRYLEPTLDVTTSNGAYLTWTFENNTDKDISLSRICFGLFEDSPIPIDSYGYGYIIRSLKYRIFTDSQKATQAVVDAIAGLEEQIASGLDNLGDRIDGLGDQIGGSIEDSTDQILNGWDGTGTPPSGSNTITDVEAMEHELLLDSKGGFNTIGDWYIESSSFIPQFANTFGFIDHLFSAVVSIGDFWFLLVVSLSIGVYAFILGLARRVK